MNDFRNHPLLELRRAEVREELLDALAKLDRELPLRLATIVGGRESRGKGADSADPCEPEREVATLGWTQIEAAERALELALASQWPLRSADERARVLDRAAGLLADRRHRMTALIVREVGKPWEDADAEVCEAIDFLRYYALSVRRLGDELVQVPGERNELRLVSQLQVGVTYAAKIEKAETRIDWQRPAQQVHDHIRGLSPFPGAWFELPGPHAPTRIKVLRTARADGAADDAPLRRLGH